LAWLQFAVLSRFDLNQEVFAAKPDQQVGHVGGVQLGDSCANGA